MCYLTQWGESFHYAYAYQIITLYFLKYLIILFVEYTSVKLGKNNKYNPCLEIAVSHL